MRLTTSLLLLLTSISQWMGLVVSTTEQRGKTLLALGDSLADGQIAPGYLHRSGLGFNDVLFSQLQTDYGFDTFINGGCPSETSVNFVEVPDCTKRGFCYSPPSCNATPEFNNDFQPRNFFNNNGTSQLEAVESYIRDHPDEVGLITLTIGANDITPCLSLTDFVEVNTCVANSQVRLGENMPVVLERLQKALAESSSSEQEQQLPPIIGTLYYNPLLAYYLPGGDPFVATLYQSILAQSNAKLTEAFNAFNVSVVDTAIPINGKDKSVSQPSGQRNDVIRTCQYTGMCNATEVEDGTISYSFRNDFDFTDNIHPNAQGYALIAQDFLDLIEKDGLLGSQDEDDEGSSPTASPTIVDDSAGWSLFSPMTLLSYVSLLLVPVVVYL